MTTNRDILESLSSDDLADCILHNDILYSACIEKSINSNCKCEKYSFNEECILCMEKWLNNEID